MFLASVQVGPLGWDPPPPGGIGVPGLPRPWARRSVLSVTVASPPRAAVEPSEVGIFRRAGRPVISIGVAAATFVLLIAVGIALRPGQDAGLARAFNGLHTGLIGSMSSAAYQIFSPVPAIIVTVVVAGILWWASGLRTGIAFGGVVALTWLPTEVVKLVVHRSRPNIALMAHPFYPVQVDPSFPSGHTAFIVAFVIALTYVLRDSRWRALVVVLGSLLAALVALSLAIDAVHYPSDIAASIVWSLAVAPAARLVWVDWILPRVTFLTPAALDR